MEVKRKMYSLYPKDLRRIGRLAPMLAPGRTQPASEVIRKALRIAEIVTARNNGTLPDDIRRALEADNE